MNDTNLGGHMGVALIAAERTRQIEKLGWTGEHDDEHDKAELAEMAECYLLEAAEQAGARIVGTSAFPLWPFRDGWKPSDDPVRNLIKAGALIAAEIDRVVRLKAAEAKEGARLPSIPNTTEPTAMSVTIKDQIEYVRRVIALKAESVAFHNSEFRRIKDEISRQQAILHCFELSTLRAILESLEVVEAVNELRENEGATVTIPSENPEPETPETAKKGN